MLVMIIILFIKPTVGNDKNLIHKNLLLVMIIIVFIKRIVSNDNNRIHKTYYY